MSCLDYQHTFIIRWPTSGAKRIFWQISSLPLNNSLKSPQKWHINRLTMITKNWWVLRQTLDKELWIYLTTCLSITLYIALYGWSCYHREKSLTKLVTLQPMEYLPKYLCEGSGRGACFLGSRTGTTPRLPLFPFHKREHKLSPHFNTVSFRTSTLKWHFALMTFVT